MKPRFILRASRFVPLRPDGLPPPPPLRRPLLLLVGVAVTATLWRMCVPTPVLLTPPPPPVPLTPVAAAIARIAVLVPCPVSRDRGVPRDRRELAPPATELPLVPTATPVAARGVMRAAIARARSTGTIGARRGRLTRGGVPPAAAAPATLSTWAAAPPAETDTADLQMGQTPCRVNHSSTQLESDVTGGEAGMCRVSGLIRLQSSDQSGCSLFPLSLRRGWWSKGHEDLRISPQSW